MSAIRLSHPTAAGLMLSARQTGGIDRLPDSRGMWWSNFGSAA